MHRRIAPLFLAVLVALPVVAPASAAEPLAPPAAEPATTPPPAPDPTPADQPSPSPVATTEPTPPPDADPAPDAGSTPRPRSTQPVGPATAPVIPDATGRYIVMLRSGSDTAAAVSRARLRAHVKADQTYTRRRPRLFRQAGSAPSDARSWPTRTSAPIVPDEVVRADGQTVPTGVSRIGGRLSDSPAIDGIDHRVDADVAIVDTGIAYHPDLNVAGGYNCSTTDRPRGATRTITGRTSPARSARSTTASASSASPQAPGCGASRSSTTTATACCPGTSAASTGSSPSATRPTRAGRSSRPST